jgi:hypothetical protein
MNKRLRMILKMLFFATLYSINSFAQFAVDPVNGNDKNSGSIPNPFKTIEKAKDVIGKLNKTMSRDIIVYLRGGIYQIGNTLNFTEKDGGYNGYQVVYKAFPGESPVLEAGVKICDWKKSGKKIWKATNIKIENFRQLYVNGVRAKRARSKTKFTGVGWPKQFSTFIESGMVRNKIERTWKLERLAVPDGIKLHNSAIQQGWKNTTDIELVWIGEESGITWRSFRLLVNSIVQTDNDSVIIKIDNYNSALSGSPSGLPYPEKPFYIENALELLDEPGEWYYDKIARDLYYMPRDGENLNKANVFIPGSAETIISVKGSGLANKVNNIVYDGIKFMHTTWLRPNTSRMGAGCVQADKYVNGINQIGRAWKALLRKESFFDPKFDFVVDTNGEAEGFKPDACIEIDAAENITIKNCRFEHLGAVGIDLTQGCNYINIIGNKFYDCSGTGIVIGRWDQDYIGLGEEVCKGVAIKNNYIEKIGQEYYNSTGITAFFSDGITIDHNEFVDFPYSAISSGWGSWNGKTSWTNSNRCNNIRYNLIRDIGKLCSDGGGIYTIGIGKAQTDPDTLTSNIMYNYIKGTGLSYGALYPDEGSCYYEWSHNVCEDVEGTKIGKWLHLWSVLHHNIKVDGNYSNSERFLNKGINCPLTNSTYYQGYKRPDGALKIIDNAGLESGYENLRNVD